MPTPAINRFVQFGNVSELAAQAASPTSSLGHSGLPKPTWRYRRDPSRSLATLNQASSGRWMSLKLPALVAFDLSMTLLQTTHVAASASLLGTSEGVAEYRAPQCGQKKVRPSRTGPT
jgi:hypothetical protein